MFLSPWKLCRWWNSLATSSWFQKTSCLAFPFPVRFFAAVPVAAATSLSKQTSRGFLFRIHPHCDSLINMPAFKATETHKQFSGLSNRKPLSCYHSVPSYLVVHICLRNTPPKQGPFCSRRVPAGHRTCPICLLLPVGRTLTTQTHPVADPAQSFSDSL